MEIEGYWTATDLIAFRVSKDEDYLVSKLIILNCFFDATWSVPSTHTFTGFSQTHAFSGPAYQDCGGSVSGSDLIFRFLDSADDSVLSWITIETPTMTITASPT